MSFLRSPEYRSQLEDTGNTTADVLELDALSQNQTFGGALPENATWGLQREVETVPSLPSVPPPTDMSSVPSTNGSLWPLFPMDNDWQIDFDDRFITEPTNVVTGATPIALNELDLSQSYNQPTQDSESPGRSRGLVEYLSPSGKVSAKATILTHISSFIHNFAN